MKCGISYLRDALEGVSGNPDDPEYLRLWMNAEGFGLICRGCGYDACLMTGPTNIMHFVGLPSVTLKLGMADDGTPRGMIHAGLTNGGSLQLR